MLKKAKRLPQRYNRPITRQTRDLARRKHDRARRRRSERMRLHYLRWKRRISTMRGLVRQFALLIVGGTILLLIGLALFSPILAIDQIIVKPRSETRIDEQKVQQALSELFGEHLFFLTQTEVRSILQDAVPDLESAQIVKQYPGTLEVHIVLDPIIAQLAIEEPVVAAPENGSGSLTETGATIPSGTPYLTSEGMYVSYSPIQVQSASGLLLLKVEDWGVRPQPWSVLMEPELLETMKQAESVLQEQFGQTITGRTFFQRAREFHLHTPSVTYWFDLRSSLEEHIHRYRLYVQTVGVDAAKEYIDLRLKDRIIYK